MTRFLIVLVLVVALIQTAAGANSPGVTASEAREFKDEAGNRLPYRLARPKGFDAAKSWPLVLFLHGAGERGEDNTAQFKNGINAFFTEEERTAHPCFIVAPQCPGKHQWVSVPWSGASHLMPEEPSVPMRLAKSLLDALLKEFPIDQKRIYVTGVSMGGFGTWDAICRWPDLFAAAVPVCGGADETRATVIAKIPLWTFHGDKDTIVQTIRSRNIVAALKAAGGEPKYTEYPGVGHVCWEKAYREPGLLAWLFAQKRP